MAGTPLNFRSTTQGSVATFNADAEYHADFKGADSHLQRWQGTLGMMLSIILWSDTTPATCVAARKGLSSHTRHTEIKFSWLHSTLAKRQLECRQVSTYDNPADILTKPTPREELSRRLALVGGELSEAVKSGQNASDLCRIAPSLAG